MNHFARAHQNKKPSTDKKILFWLLLALAALTFFGAPLVMRSQEISNTYHVSQFAGPDVGTKLTNAQASCSPNTSIPCSIVIDAILAVWPQGTPPTRCTQCIWFDYRTPAFSATPSAATLPGVHIQVFTTTNNAFVIPAANMDCSVIGGGGGGGGSSATTVNGGGGGSGGFAEKVFTGLTPGLTLNMTVGAGGTGGPASTGGNNGSGSTISSGTQTVSSVITNGGLGGASTATISAGGGGAALSSGGDVNGAGIGGSPSLVSTVSGMGGSTMLGGGGGVSGGGAGNAAIANTGSGGGGAGAGTAAAGGSGAAGIIFCKWVQ